MNKLVKTALLASALGFLSINAYAEIQWIGSGHWQGDTRGNGMRPAGMDREEACKNAIYVNIQNSYPESRHQVFTRIKEGSINGNFKDSQAQCFYDIIYPDYVSSNHAVNIYYFPNYVPSKPAN